MSVMCEAARECQGNRVIALIDMDCFYAQVEQRDQPDLWGKPVGVVQYNAWKKGALIAVSYEARPFGVKRNMRGEEALQKCPEIALVTVPTNREKADLTKYRNASAEVFKVLCNFSPDIVVEKASVDEAFLDLTTLVDKKMETIDADTDPEDLSLYPSTFVLMNSTIPEDDQVPRLNEWFEKLQTDFNNLRFAFAAQIVEKIRKEILEQTKFHCSAGVAKNKMLAKLICSRHKPRKQSVLLPEYIPALMETTDISAVRNLGGKLGASITDGYGITKMGQLAKIKDTILRKDFGEKTGDWIFCLARGNDCEAVTARDLTLSIGCSKNFFGKQALKTKEEVVHWLENLSQEMEVRLLDDQEKNSRTARRLTVGIRLNGLGPTQQKHFSRAVPLSTYTSTHIAKMALNLLQEFNKAPVGSDEWKPRIASLHLSAGKFDETVEPQSRSITDFFATSPRKRRLEDDNSNLDTPTEGNSTFEQSPSCDSLQKMPVDAFIGGSPSEKGVSPNAEKLILHSTMIENHSDPNSRNRENPSHQKPTCSKNLNMSLEKDDIHMMSIIESPRNAKEGTLTKESHQTLDDPTLVDATPKPTDQEPVNFPSTSSDTINETPNPRPKAMEASQFNASMPLFMEEDPPMEVNIPEPTSISQSLIRTQDILQNEMWDQDDRFNCSEGGEPVNDSAAISQNEEGPRFDVEQCALHPKDYSEIDADVFSNIPFELQFEYRTFFLAKQNGVGSDPSSSAKPKPRPVKAKSRGKNRTKPRGRLDSNPVTPAAKPITEYFKH